MEKSDAKELRVKKSSDYNNGWDLEVTASSARTTVITLSNEDLRELRRQIDQVLPK